MRNLLFLLLAVSTYAVAGEPRVFQSEKIDLIRANEGGEVHLALRCSRGVAADTMTTCDIRKSVQGTVIAQHSLPYGEAKTLIHYFFTQIPKREVASSDSGFHQAAGSPLHWKISDGKRYNYGSLLIHGTKAQEDARQALESSVLVVEQMLNNKLIIGEFDGH